MSEQAALPPVTRGGGQDSSDRNGLPRRINNLTWGHHRKRKLKSVSGSSAKYIALLEAGFDFEIAAFTLLLGVPLRFTRGL